MTNTIDYRKAVDVIDEGILQLNSFRCNHSFPVELKEDLNNILEFLKQANKPEYESLLFDKRITIDRHKLNTIHKKINELQFSEQHIENAIQLLNKISAFGLTTEEIDCLEDYLLEFSKPMWMTINFKD